MTRGALRNILLVGLAAASLAACASPQAGGTASPTPAASAKLAAGQALDGTIVLVDAGVNGAEAAHKAGILVGGNWLEAKSVIDKVNSAIGLAKAAYTAGSSGDVMTALAQIPTMLSELAKLTSNAGSTAGAAAGATAGDAFPAGQ